MSIWFKNPDRALMTKRGAGTLVEHLGIDILEVGEDFIRAEMPVDHRTIQPHGILHGGASVALAESLASTAGNFVVDNSKEYCVGLEINANHLKSVSSGVVQGISRPLHIGRSTQVWETRITQGDKLVCISRMTLAVLKRV